MTYSPHNYRKVGDLNKKPTRMLIVDPVYINLHMSMFPFLKNLRIIFCSLISSRRNPFETINIHNTTTYDIFLCPWLEFIYASFYTTILCFIWINMRFLLLFSLFFSGPTLMEMKAHQQWIFKGIKGLIEKPKEEAHIWIHPRIFPTF